MNFKCEKSTLQEACLISARAVPSKSPISSLEGLKIEADKDIKITGYDLKKGIFTTIEAEVGEPGTIIINSRFFIEMLRRMPDGTVTVTSDAKTGIFVKCGNIEYSFVGLDVGEYPDMPIINTLNSISLPQKVLKNMISRTLFAVAKEEIRPIYTGSLFEINNNELTLVSVDGYRLARRIEKVTAGKMENCTFIVPGFALSDIEKICSDSDDLVHIAVGEKHISFYIGNTVLITRRLEGEFLNHRKSVPESFRYTLKINRQELIAVIERVSLMLNDSNTSPVRFAINDCSINCLCISPLGKAEDTCICEGNGEGIEIGFNDRYMLDALKAAETDDLSLCINTSSSPCIIKAADGTDNFTYMILPVRLRNN